MADQFRNEQPGVRGLAKEGRLADYFGIASTAERRRLRIEGYELLHPVVFGHLTRKVEARRNHRDCMVSVRNLRPDCLDRFHDDIDAVLDDLFRSARQPILNLEGWVSKRLIAVTVDAHRRRRGERGALQRPRIPRWLARELNNDQRLIGLALDMLDWVGVEATAGVSDWPIAIWASERMANEKGCEDPSRSVTEDVMTVLAAMRKRPKWYLNYVERPMGHKRPSLLSNPRHGWEPASDSAQAARDAHAADDARRAELAALAVTAIRSRVQQGEDVHAAVIGVINAVFGSDTGAQDLDRLPAHDGTDDEWVAVRLADPATVDRIVAVVLDLLSI
jgi:hypothetical protein